MLLVAALLAGCASASAGDGGSAGPQSADRSVADFGPHGPGPEDRPDPALAGEPVPTLPPGDPGRVDAGGADESADHDHDDHGADRPVPSSALLDAETVSAVVGGSWAAAGVDTDAETCLVGALRAAPAVRSAVLASGDGRLAQAVGRYAAADAARAAVDATVERLAGCGFAPVGDPRIGERSQELTATGGTYARAVVVAAEGAVTVLAAGGSAAAEQAWPALADLSVGTLCAAGVHGCH
jgi:hypothetical protein